MSNYKVFRDGELCVIKEKGKIVAEMVGELAAIYTKHLTKFFCDELSCIHVKGKPKTLKQDKRKIKELERLLWQ